MLGRFLLGTMQGRLAPKLEGRYQAHPKGYWRDEFDVAAESGLELIEFILDYEDADANPLFNNVSAIQHAIAESGVGVKSICADYFMTAPLQREPKSVTVLEQLIDTSGRLGIRDIVIPCVDQSSLVDEIDIMAFVNVIQPLAKKAQTKDVNLSLETDLAPRAFAKLLDRIGSKAVTVNYDMGNSAALGYDPVEEFSAYGDCITDIHIKDRLQGGGPVVLGEGHCDFDTVFYLINKSTYTGPLIMQAYRDDEGLVIFEKQRAWLEHNYGELLQ